MRLLHTSKDRGSCRARLAPVVAVLAAFGSGCGDDNDATPSDQTTGGDGQALFEANCASCHGTDLGGTSTGPPFLSQIYEPNHHPDDSFRRAVAQGVQPHHWDFGAMPPVEGLDDSEVDAIIGYVRTVQRANGIG